MALVKCEMPGLHVVAALWVKISPLTLSCTDDLDKYCPPVIALVVFVVTLHVRGYQVRMAFPFGRFCTTPLKCTCNKLLIVSLKNVACNEFSIEFIGYSSP